MSFNDAREFSLMEGKIAQAESRLEKLQAELGSSDNQANSARLSELCAEIDKAQSAVEKLYYRWSELDSMKD